MTAIMALFGQHVLAENGRGLATVIGGALAVHLVGLVDDVRPMRARWKFLAQIVDRVRRVHRRRARHDALAAVRRAS